MNILKLIYCWILSYKPYTYIMRANSLFVVFVFLVNSIAIAGLNNTICIESIDIKTATNKIDSLFIPENYGTIIKKYLPDCPIDNKKRIILIQDAHCNYEAQHNIARILEILARDYNIDLVSVEGASGDLDLSEYGRIEDEKIKEKATDIFVKKGVVTGPEYLAITKYNKLPFGIYGIEDGELYVKNLISFRNTISNLKETGVFIKELIRVSEQLRGRIYNKELLQFTEQEEKYYDNELSLTDYCRLLKTRVEGLKIEDFSNFNLVINSIQLEEGIDFNKVEAERNELIKTLEKTLVKEDLEQLVRESLGYRLGKLSSYDYYVKLDGYLNGQLSLTNLSNYIRLIKLQSRIDSNVLFQEIEKITNEIKEALYQNQLERSLDNLTRKIRILNKLFHLTLTGEEFSYFQANKLGFSTDSLLSFIKIQAPLNNISIPQSLADEEFLKKVQEAIVPADRFYEEALQRDRVLVENTISKMEKDEEDMAVMITGGFHTEGISRIMEEKGLGYTVVSPKITKVQEDNPYLLLMMDGRLLSNKNNISQNTLAAPEYVAENNGLRGWVDGLGQIGEEWSNMLLAELNELMRKRREGSIDEHEFWEVFTALVAKARDEHPESELAQRILGDIENAILPKKGTLKEKKEHLEKEISEIEKEIYDEIGKDEYPNAQEKIESLQEKFREYEDTINLLVEKEGLADERGDFMVMIPTMDRPESLGRLLGSLEDELRLFGYSTNRRVHIVIVDDSSDPKNRVENGRVIKEFRDRTKDLSNVSVEFYSIERQYELMKRLKDSGVDLGFFINKDLGKDIPQTFGRKGYAGARNMLRVIAIFEIDERFRDNENLLVASVDDDVEFCNLLTSGYPKAPDAYIQGHVYNYFDRVARLMKGQNIDILSGSYTGAGANQPSIGGVIRRSIEYNPPTVVEAKDVSSPLEAGILGGNYVCTKRFILESIPVVPSGIRGEDIIYGLIVGGWESSAIPLFHNPTIGGRDFESDILNDFKGVIFANFLRQLLSINGRLKGIHSVRDRWDRIIDIVADFKEGCSLWRNTLQPYLLDVVRVTLESYVKDSKEEEAKMEILSRLFGIKIEGDRIYYDKEKAEIWIKDVVNNGIGLIMEMEERIPAWQTWVSGFSIPTEVTSGERLLEEEYRNVLTQLADDLGIAIEELESILSKKDSELIKALINLLRKDGKVTEEEIRAIVDQADKVEEVFKRADIEVNDDTREIQEKIALFLAIMELEKMSKETKRPEIVNRLQLELERRAGDVKVDKDAISGIIDYLCEIGAFSENGQPTRYFHAFIGLLKETFRVKEGDEIGGLINEFIKYKYIQVVVKKEFKIKEGETTKPSGDINEIITRYIHYRDKRYGAGIANILAIYLYNPESFKGKLKEEQKEGLDTLIKRKGLSGEVDAIGAMKREVFDETKLAGKDKEARNRHIGELTKARITGEDVLGAEFLYKEYWDEISEKCSLEARDMFKKLNNTIFVHDLFRVFELTDKGYCIDSVSIDFIKKVQATKESGNRSLFITESPLLLEQKQMWIKTFGREGVEGITGEDFISVEDYNNLVRDGKTMVVMVRVELNKGLKHREGDRVFIIGEKEYDPLLLTNMAIIAASEKDLDGMKPRFKELLKVYYGGTFGEDDIDEMINKMTNIGGIIQILLPPISPFVKAYYNALKGARGIVSSAA